MSRFSKTWFWGLSIPGLVLLLLSCVSLAQEPPFQGLVNANRVNLRSGPSLKAQVLTQLSKGDSVNVLDRKGDWVVIQLPSETPVYVSKNHVELVSGLIRVKSRKLHLRAGPGQAYPSLGLFKKGDTAEVRRVVREWIEVDPPKFARGWMHRNYVAALPPEPPVFEPKQEIANGNDRGLQESGTEGGQDPGGQGTSQRR